MPVAGSAEGRICARRVRFLCGQGSFTKCHNLDEVASVESAVKSEQYWERFSILPGDLDYLINTLLERERPETLESLVRILIAYRHQQLQEVAEKSLSQGRIYRPGEHYQVGERLMFPHLGNIAGTVAGLRPGRNPEHEPFTVLTVALDKGGQRDFAGELPGGHPLDLADYAPVGNADPDTLYARYGARVEALLRSALEADSHFVTIADEWFVRELLMDVSPMQLNIVEAMLDMVGGGPLAAADLLKEMDLPAEIPPSLQIFSLECALMRDPRFDEVGPSGIGLWYLRRMEPSQVQETPPLLRYMPIPHNRALLDEGMLALESQIEDEWANTAIQQDLPAGAPVTLVLSYPHWRSGTLPLTERLSRLFPTARTTDRVRFSFVDGDGGQEIPGWVVRGGRYVFGLGAWYAEQKVGPGAYIDLLWGEQPGIIQIQARPFRSKRGEWLRTVSARADSFAFEVTRYPVFCEFDELAAIGVPEPDAVDELAQRLRRLSLEQLLDQIFQGLAVLSLQRAVHSITLYSVLNLFRRVPPAPMQAVLASGAQYVALGDNYWSYRGDF